MNLHGWDVVSALSFPTVNEQLRRSFGTLPATFAFLDEGPAGTRLELDGTFGGWQLETGGGGNLVHVALAIAQGTYLRRNPQGDTRYDLAGVVVTVELLLNLLPAAGTPGHELRFDFRTAQGQVPADPSVFCKNVTLPPGSGIALTGKLLVGQAITQCLFAHPAAVAYVFATLGAGSPAGGLPTRSALLTVAPAGTDEWYLAILSAVLPGQGQGQAALDPALFAQAAPAVLALSKEYLLRDVLLPQLPTLFRHGTGAASFRYEQGAITSTGAFHLDAVKSGALWYQPVVQQLNLTVDGDALQVRVRGNCYISPGIYARFACCSRNPVVVEGQGMRFAADPHPTVEHGVDVAAWVLAGAVVLALVAAVVELVVAAVVFGVTMGVTRTLNGIESACSLQALNPAFLTWEGFQLQHISSGGLSNNLYLRGD